jgi:hypothetical protein
VSDTPPKAAAPQFLSAPTESVPQAPGSASAPHPTDGIPLPEHGFDTLDDTPIRELAAVPAVEVITRASVLLMSASAEKLGLAPNGEPYVDLDEARRLITALAGLLAASQSDLGVHRQPLTDGLKSLQAAFREASRYPDEPGKGPGEHLLS